MGWGMRGGNEVNAAARWGSAEGGPRYGCPMTLAMLTVLAMLAWCFGTAGTAAMLGGTPRTPGEDEGLRRLRTHAARAMVLAWCTGERAETGPVIFGAAMAYARGLGETEAMLVAADHRLAVRAMESALTRWRNGGR